MLVLSLSSKTLSFASPHVDFATYTAHRSHTTPHFQLPCPLPLGVLNLKAGNKEEVKWSLLETVSAYPFPWAEEAGALLTFYLF